MSDLESTSLEASSGKHIDVGSVVDEKYRLDSLIGGGANGLVYKATHLILGDVLAIKILRKELVGDEVNLGRFKREAQIASQLHHPNLVAVKAYGVSNGHPYLVMDYVDGESLSACLKEHSKLEISKFVEIFSELANALDYAHENDVIHRDIKPGNIMLTVDGARLIDFGLAKIVDESETSASLTRTGVITGTPNYMSPEQCRADKLTASTDIYSLGAVMFESLTGQAPFTGATDLLVMSEHLNSQPVFPPGTAIPPAIKNIVLKALAKDRADRFYSAKEVFAELQALSADELSSNAPTKRAGQKLNTTVVISCLLLSILAAGLIISAIIGPAAKKDVIEASTSVKQKPQRLILSNAAGDNRSADDWLESAKGTQRITGHRTDPELIAEAKTLSANAMQASLREKDNDKYVISALLWCEVARDAGSRLERFAKLKELDKFVQKHSDISKQVRYRVQQQLGNAYYEQEDFYNARKSFQSGLTLADTNSEEQLDLLRQIALTYARDENFDAADKELKKIKMLCRDLNISNQMAFSAASLAKVAMDHGKYSLSMKYLYEVEAVIKKCTSKRIQNELVGFNEICLRQHRHGAESKLSNKLLAELREHLDEGEGEFSEMFVKEHQLQRLIK